MLRGGHGLTWTRGPENQEFIALSRDADKLAKTTIGLIARADETRNAMKATLRFIAATCSESDIEAFKAEMTRSKIADGFGVRLDKALAQFDAEMTDEPNK